MPRVNYIPGEDPDSDPKLGNHKRRERKRRRQVSSVLGGGNVEPTRERERHGRRHYTIDDKNLLGEVLQTSRGTFFVTDDGDVYSLKTKKLTTNERDLKAVQYIEEQKYDAGHADEYGYLINEGESLPRSIIPKELEEKAKQGSYPEEYDNFHYEDLGNDKYIAGQLYKVDYVEYLYDLATNKIYRYTDEGFVLVEDEDIIKAVQELKEKDDEALKCRMYIDECLSGPKILKEILSLHTTFTCGKIKPIYRDGIIFFQVGKSETHAYYAGYKNNKKYKYVRRESWIPEQMHNPEAIEDNQPDFEGDIIEVKKWGYVGEQ